MILGRKLSAVDKIDNIQNRLNGFMSSFFRNLCLLILGIEFAALLTGCGVMNKLVVRASRPLIFGTIQALLAETDLELARTALEANLKLLDGMIISAPDDSELLVLAAQGWTGYAMLFVETVQPLRATEFYRRGCDYGLRALAIKGKVIERENISFSEFERSEKSLRKSDIPAVYWATAAWTGWINLNRRQPSAIAQFPRVKVLMDWLYIQDAGFYYSGPCWLLGSYYASLPPILGGNLDIARRLFEQADSADGAHFLWGRVLYAKFYAVCAQDRQLFEMLLNEVIVGSKEEQAELRLVNRVAVHQAKWLLSQIDELFL